MSVDLKTYAALKRKVEELQSQRDKAQGAFDQLISQLEEDFGCKTLEEAQELQQRLERTAKKAEKGFEKSLANFQEKWRNVLEEEG